jgi:CPA2 family monovalent cation:H+ antiporter-2
MGQVSLLHGGGQDAAQGKDPDRLRQATTADNSVVFGGALRLQSLMATGVARASAVVVTYLDTRSPLKVLCNVREHAPGVAVIVRTVDDHDLETLLTKGATEMVPEAIKGSLILARNALPDPGLCHQRPA